MLKYGIPPIAGFLNTQLPMTPKQKAGPGEKQKARAASASLLESLPPSRSSFKSLAPMG